MTFESNIMKIERTWLSHLNAFSKVSTNRRFTTEPLLAEIPEPIIDEENLSIISEKVDTTTKHLKSGLQKKGLDNLIPIVNKGLSDQTIIELSTLLLLKYNVLNVINNEFTPSIIEDEEIEYQVKKLASLIREHHLASNLAIDDEELNEDNKFEVFNEYFFDELGLYYENVSAKTTIITHLDMFKTYLMVISIYLTGKEEYTQEFPKLTNSINVLERLISELEEDNYENIIYLEPMFKYLTEFFTNTKIKEKNKEQIRKLIYVEKTSI